MKKFLLVFIAICSIYANPASAKNNKDLMKANYLYRQLAFHEAIPYYEKVAETSADPELFSNLANCYRLTGNFKEAASSYAKAVTLKDCPDIVKLHLSQSLMTLGKYNKALHWLREYKKSDPTDKRIANLIKSCEQAPKVLSGMPSGYVSLLNFNTDGSEFGPTLNNGNLIFSSDTLLVNQTKGGNRSKEDAWTGNSFYNLYSVSCDQNGSCSKVIKKVAADINTKFHDGPATFADYGNTMYFTRTTYEEKFLNKGPLPDLNGTVHLEIMIASGYDDITAEFKKLKPFQYNSKKYSTAQPTISPDGNTLVFVSDMPDGQGGNDLYICRKDKDGNWSKPENLIKLNTQGDEMFPSFLTNDALSFSSNGLIGLGGLDIYKTKWNKSSKSFTKPKHMGIPINSSYDDMSLVYNYSGTSGYLCSNRPTKVKGDNIYFMKFQKLYLSVNIIDDQNDKPVKAASVSVQRISQKNNKFLSGENGNIFTRLRPQSSYNITIRKAGYKPYTLAASTQDIQKAIDTLNYTVRLTPVFNINYQAVILNKTTLEPIDEALLVVSKLGGSKADTNMILANQVFSTSLESNAEYSIYALKNNFFSNEKFISTKGIKHARGSVTIKDTIYMKELKVGEVYKIEDIYYDFDKANIREDAKKSLNSLIDLLQQYPKMTIQINSYTDCRGSNQYNMRLSKARAHSVIKYLQERGMSMNRLHYKGFGETHPAVDCKCSDCTEVQYQENRRTEFQIISM